MGYEDEDDTKDLEPAGVDETGRPVVKHVIRDLASAVKIKQADAKAKAQAAKAEAQARSEAARAQAQAAQLRARVELTKIKLKTSSREAAAKHLATFAGLYMTLMVLSFLAAVKFIEEAHIAVVAGLITLVVPQIGALLRSIVTAGNGHEKDEKKKPEQIEQDDGE